MTELKAKALYFQGNTVVAQFPKENVKMSLVHHMTFHLDRFAHRFSFTYFLTSTWWVSVLSQEVLTLPKHPASLPYRKFTCVLNFAILNVLKIYGYGIPLIGIVVLSLNIITINCFLECHPVDDAVFTLLSMRERIVPVWKYSTCLEI